MCVIDALRHKYHDCAIALYLHTYASTYLDGQNVHTCHHRHKIDTHINTPIDKLNAHKNVK
jgi:hypothetical protein